jgi:hypothetical protein
MARATLSASGFVLSRSATAGGYERLGVICGEAGFLHLMRRPDASPKGGSQPDLFDHCAVQLESRQGGAWFVREYEVLRRYNGIGARYEALVAAGDWARLALANAADVESTEGLFGITAKLLDALDRGAQPQATLLKALFLFARNEGLPASEEWLRELPAVQRETAMIILVKPLAELDEKAVSGVQAADIAALADNITKWMCQNHHIVAPYPAQSGG